jgi:hypothetical protein
MRCYTRPAAWTIVAFALAFASTSSANDALELNLRSLVRSKEAATSWQHVNRSEQWDLKETAVVICDSWDFHHCGENSH